MRRGLQPGTANGYTPSHQYGCAGFSHTRLYPKRHRCPRHHAPAFTGGDNYQVAHAYKCPVTGRVA
jgi:hypothetical protein